MSEMRKVVLAASAMIIGMDFAREPDFTAYYRPSPAKAPDPKKRAKIKAARKQKHRKP